MSILDDANDLADALSSGRTSGPSGAQYLAGRVVDRGHLTWITQTFVTLRPVVVGGPEVEGGPVELADRDGAYLNVAWLQALPSPGQMAVAVAMPNRWVAISSRFGPTLGCWPCSIPRKDLAVEWTNPVLGGGNATLKYQAPGQWSSACTHGLLYRLACPGSVVQFRVAYFLSGTCPSGQQQECASNDPPPFSLRLTSYSCDPFEFVYTLTGAGCPFLAVSGYSKFRVYDPEPDA